MPNAKTASKKVDAWDSPENEAQNSFVSWGQPGDFIYGTLISTKKVKSTLPDKEGQLQNVYEVKVKDCSYHVLDDKKRVIEDAIIPEEGAIVSVGGRAFIDSRMAHVKVGQVFGLKFEEELPAKTKGYNPTKVIKVFTPRDPSGNGFLMDEEFLASLETEDDIFGDKN